MPQGTRHPMIEHLDAFVGQWETEATHQHFPGVVVHGDCSFERLEGGQFLIWRSRNEHPDFPDSISIIGYEDRESADDSGDPDSGCSLRYFDSRGVSRLYSVEAEPGVFRFWRDHPGFAQRFTGRLSADGNTLAGVVEPNQDGATWQDDLRLTFKRVT